MDPQSGIWYIALAAILFIVLRRTLKKHGTLPLPPGPPPLPIIGNALDIPTHDAPTKFREMSAKYGKSGSNLLPTPPQYVLTGV